MTKESASGSRLRVSEIRVGPSSSSQGWNNGMEEVKRRCCFVPDANIRGFLPASFLAPQFISMQAAPTGSNSDTRMDCIGDKAGNVYRILPNLWCKVMTLHH